MRWCLTSEADPICICHDLKMNGLHYTDTYTAAVYDIPSEPATDLTALAVPVHLRPVPLVVHTLNRGYGS